MANFKIMRNELNTEIVGDPHIGQSSEDVTVTVTDDGTYQEYDKNLYYSYVYRNQVYRAIADKNSSNEFIIPMTAFLEPGIVKLSLELSNGTNKPTCNACFIISTEGAKSVAASDILPDEETWQSYIQSYIKSDAVSGVIAQASTAQTNLQNATNSATNVFNQLTAENISAKANLDALRSEDFNAQEILSGVTDIRAYLGMIETEDVLGITMDYKNKTCTRIAGARPSTGVSQNLTRPNIEQMAKNRGEGWHSLGIKTASMEQLLMIVEMGMMNLQTAIGQGVVNLPWTTGSDTTSSYAGATGSTASLGNGTGRATETTTYEGGVATKNTVDGKTSICYRGVENFWGNVWKFVYGVNFYYENGKPFLGYVCKDFNYAESKSTDNYENIGFALPSENGYISAMGYSTKYDWLFLPSEVKGNSSLPVGDYYNQDNTWDGYRIALLGGPWTVGSAAGGFCWYLYAGVGYRYRIIGGRLVYVPTVTV